MNRQYFNSKSENRKWPYPALPGYLYFINDEDHDLLQEWYHATDGLYEGDTDCTALTFIAGLVMGGPSIKRIVQLGTYAGLTALVVGMILRERSSEGLMASVDIAEKMVDFTQGYIDKGGLNDRVKLFAGDSASPATAGAVTDFIGGPPQLIFIDSSHASNRLSNV